jgi:hypothetical protein
MSLRKLYQWVKHTSKGWQGVSRHFRANVGSVEAWYVPKAVTSARLPGVAVDAPIVSGDAYSAFWLLHSR